MQSAASGFPENLGSHPRSNPRRRLMARTRTTGKRRGQALLRAGPSEKGEKPQAPCLKKFQPQNCGAVAQTFACDRPSPG